MNKNVAIIGGIVAIVIVGGLVFYSAQNNATPSSNNTTSTTTTGTTTNTDQMQQSGAPLVTTNVSVAPSDTTAVLSGTVVPNGAFTNYWYEYGVSSNLDNKMSSRSVGSGYVFIPAPGYITGLVKDTTYYFRLVAENQYGRIAGAQYSFQTTHGNPPPVGSDPTARTLAANGISRTTADLNGEVNPNRAATQYWFEYGKTANLGDTTAFVSAGEGNSNVSALRSLSNLNPDTTYYFRLNAQNQFGTVNGAILNFKTAGPPSAAAPSAATRSATTIGTSTATLRGTVDPNGAETMYWFEYSTDSLLGSVLMRTTGQLSAGTGSNTVLANVDISNLSSNTTYYFRIVAQNNLGTVRGDRATFKTTKTK